MGIMACVGQEGSWSSAGAADGLRAGAEAVWDRKASWGGCRVWTVGYGGRGVRT